MKPASPAQTVQDLIYSNIDKISHIKTYRFLKALSEEESLSSDGIVRLSYTEWHQKYDLNSFTLAEVVKECRKLKLIKTEREPNEGNVGRTPQAYKLNLK